MPTTVERKPEVQDLVEIPLGGPGAPGAEQPESRWWRRVSIAGIIAPVALLAGIVVLLITTNNSNPASSSAPKPAVTKTAPAPAATGPIAVSLREFTITPSAVAAPAGKVTFTVRNAGTVPHELVVVRTDKPAAGLLRGARADETGNVGETGDMKPGLSKRLTLNLNAGHYALVCNLPGHYAAGQHIDFTVR
jgi:uncharacterized cupredoxin-like copper-binding protein